MDSDNPRALATPGRGDDIQRAMAASDNFFLNLSFHQQLPRINTA